MPAQSFPSDCDVLVVGSGAAGLAAAVTAAWHGQKVVLVEKDPVFGGATAWSGGWAWVPRNPLAQRAGICEDIEQPRTYLRNELGTRYDAERVDAFLEACPHMVAFFERHTTLQFA
ncbi:MAG: FAD-dependent oxidoreductase, partial [Pseudomonas sp.]|uniref:FAD-dependent oxidoreductase n=2 Tax=Pseudomonas TaxID=286 RepID=UPI00331521DC